MSIFSKLFGKSKEEPEKLPDHTSEITEYLGCECVSIDSGLDADGIMKLYLNAYEEGKASGFTPVIVVGDGVIIDALDIGTAGISDVEKARSELLSGDHSEGEALLNEAFHMHTEGYLQYDSDSSLEKLYGEYTGKQASDKSFHISYNYKFGTKSSRGRLILAKIPTDKPWEVFAWIPFGGWNDCPDAKDMMSVCKYWYEEYGAVPAVISYDTLEMYLPEPVTSKDTSLKIAEEQYGFCADIIEQGTGTIKALAEIIVNSNIWFFWWD